jgi:ATP/maltotriose-dependent transcriptional regulator MalT
MEQFAVAEATMQMMLFDWQPGGRVLDHLTARERAVLVMIGQGYSNKRVARALEISPETVKSHVKHIFLKLAVSSRTEAVFRAGTLGLL